MGSTILIKSFFSLVIKLPLLLFRAILSNKLAAEATSDFISFMKAFQAFLLAALTSFLASFSKEINSSSAVINFKELPFWSSNSKFKIHERIFSIQSNSFSHFRRSIFLYLSWEPEVEWPWGWVTSFTWIKTGTCCSLAILEALVYTSINWT